MGGFAAGRLERRPSLWFFSLDRFSRWIPGGCFLAARFYSGCHKSVSEKLHALNCTPGSFGKPRHLAGALTEPGIGFGKCSNQLNSVARSLRQRARVLESASRCTLRSSVETP